MLKPFAMAALATLAILSLGGPVSAADPENTLYLDVPKGRVIIELRPDLAPKTVAQIKALTRRGFYDGIKFHRVIPGFMAQTGDPTGTGTGGSGKSVPAEFSQAHFIRGSVGMARALALDPDLLFCGSHSRQSCLALLVLRAHVPPAPRNGNMRWRPCCARWKTACRWCAAPTMG